MVYARSSCGIQNHSENLLKSSLLHLKMKIAILVPAFPPKTLAGTELATYNIARYLVKMGHEVHVITPLDKGLPKVSIENGFYVHRISLQTVRFFGSVLFWIKILSVLKKIRPDIVNVHDIEMGMTGFWAKSFLKKPYTVYGRGTEVYSSWIFKKPISRIVLKNADAVIVLTDDMKRKIKETCNRDIFVIPNGIEIAKFQNLSKENIRRNMEITKDKKIITFVGRLHSVKGVKYLIEAMKIIRQKDTNTKLMLIGDGEDRYKLEALVKKLNLGGSVIFIGEVSNEKIPKYMIASDVLVLPSLMEGFPNIILEGMASGLPIVTTDVGGVSEIIKNGKNGFLVKPRNPKEIAEKVLLLLENNKLIKIISEKNKEDVIRYDWESVAKKLEEVYLSLCTRTIPGRNIY